MRGGSSFHWCNTRNRIRHGLYDFGLFKDEVCSENSSTTTNPSPSRGKEIYLSRTVLIVAVVASVIFVTCFLLADKKSSKTPHFHYAYVYGDKTAQRENNPEPPPPPPPPLPVLSFGEATTTTTDLNDLASIRTVLHSVQKISSNRMPKNVATTTSSEPPKKRDKLYLADILKRTEAKPAGSNEGNDRNLGQNYYKNYASNEEKFDQNYENSYKKGKYLDKNYANVDKSVEYGNDFGKNIENRDENSNDLSYAQLQIYKKGVRVKSVKDAIRYVTCSYVGCDVAAAAEGNDRAKAINEGLALPREENDDFYSTSLKDLTPAESNLVISPGIRDRYKELFKRDPFEDATQPTANKDEGSRKRFLRFSNRIYNRNDLAPTLDYYLKPPTPAPVSPFSFTPSYTTAIFHGFDQKQVPRDSFGLESQIGANAEGKPISLMVEIYPADSEIAGNSKFQEFASNDASSLTSSDWIPKLFPTHNKMRLRVNLFPQAP